MSEDSHAPVGEDPGPIVVCVACRTFRVYGTYADKVPQGAAHCGDCHATVAPPLFHCGSCHATFADSLCLSAHRQAQNGGEWCRTPETPGWPFTFDPEGFWVLQ